MIRIKDYHIHIIQLVKAFINAYKIVRKCNLYAFRLCKELNAIDCMKCMLKTI